MREYLINIDLYCYRRDNSPKNYRLYLDGDLITERTYFWVNDRPDKDPGQFVKENVWVEISPGEHEIRIEALENDSKFYYKNLLVDNQPVEHVNGKFTIS